jgi:hypothetical protein
MTKDEALKLALEALEHAAYCVQKNYCPDKMGHDWDDTITAIRETLAQPPLPVQPAPVQEPVAWVRLEAWQSGAEWPDDCFTGIPADGLVPLYTAPPLPVQRNFCPRCGKRTADPTTIHTCTPPQENT